jgi:hypothetical protein
MEAISHREGDLDAERGAVVRAGDAQPVQHVRDPAQVVHVLGPQVSLLDAALAEPAAVAWRAIGRSQPRPGERIGLARRGGRLPVSQVTSAAFGGADLSTLYVTTARENFTPADLRARPQAGDIFACTPGVTGRLPYLFGA